MTAMRDLVMMAMSLADRPRPALLQVRSILKGQLFTFVWLPREELTTARRTAIAMLLEDEVGREITSWSVELGDGDLALIRYTQYIDEDAPLPDAEALDAAVVEMVRGWSPAVEAELIAAAGAARATRLALTYLGAFPDGYRARTAPGRRRRRHPAAVRACRRRRPRRAHLALAIGCARGSCGSRPTARGGLIPLSEAVPVLENFGFRVLEEMPDRAGRRRSATSTTFGVELGGRGRPRRDPRRGPARSSVRSPTCCAASAEDDEFNQLVLYAGLDTAGGRLAARLVPLPAPDRKQLRPGHHRRRAAPRARCDARAHRPVRRRPRPGRRKGREAQVDKYREQLDRVAGQGPLDRRRPHPAAPARAGRSDRPHQRLRPGGRGSARVQDRFARWFPACRAPVPWREIWVYSPRVEGIHLRGGPVARGGLRWSDRRDDFRTEILGLMKAQLVKNAVIVPTGAKGGFYPKQLPPMSNRDAWLAEGTESYRIFIRSLLSVTDNLVNDKVVHPERGRHPRRRRPLFRRRRRTRAPRPSPTSPTRSRSSATSGSATRSPAADRTATTTRRWGSPPRARGSRSSAISSRWASTFSRTRSASPAAATCRATCSATACCCRRRSSWSPRSTTATSSSTPIPIRPTSWKERKRLFDLPRSSWDDYDRKLISKGGGIFPRTEKSIALSAEAREALGIDSQGARPGDADQRDPQEPGRPAVVRRHRHLHQGVERRASPRSAIPSNDALRANADELRAKVIGEGANLAITQAGRIEFAEHGGRINTDFIDNSAGVDCSDNEVNIKIPLNREMREGRLSFDKRNTLLARMTDEVAELVLEDNRLQTLALSIAEAGGAQALPGHVRTIELLEASGRLDRKVEGLASSEELIRRGAGKSRPDPARARGRAVDLQAGAAGRGRGAAAVATTGWSSRSCSTPSPSRCARPTPMPSAPTGCATRSSPPRSPTGSSTASARALRST